ncbi:hypothetical protein Y032_0498g2521 [Ancylostoma ceylanicum]|uniref:Uncharacterized protein n=1 Tax=Ancylostoma ceylanicum TaxID=53326 RepID=A0A016WUB5_9BILA|nr:hypothetical protein Y032_0498g2521 [Ancylostoma ceylanicum]
MVSLFIAETFENPSKQDFGDIRFNKTDVMQSGYNNRDEHIHVFKQIHAFKFRVGNGTAEVSLTLLLFLASHLISRK